MTKETLDTICKPPKKPFYMRIKLTPLNAYRIILFAALLAAFIHISNPTVFQIIQNAFGAATVVFVFTSLSLWTKSKSKTSLGYSSAVTTLFVFNAVLVFTIIYIFTKWQNV